MPETPAAEPRVIRTSEFLFFLAVAIYIYTQLFAAPFTPIYFDGDTFVPVSNAIRIINGEVIFRDFFHFISPGADVYYAVVFSIFGEKLAVINLTIAALTLAQVFLIHYFSRRFLTGYAVYLPSVIFLVCGFRQFAIDGSYRLFSLVLALTAAAVLIGGRSTRKLVIAGSLCGLASAFQQQRGVLVVGAILVFLLWENYLDGFDLKRLIRQAATVSIAFGVVFALTQAYFVLTAGPEHYYASMVTFIRENYRADPLNNNAAYLSDLRALIEFAWASGSALSGYFRGIFIAAFYYALIPYVYAVFFAFVWWKRREFVRGSNLRGLVLLSLTGVFLAIGVSAPTIIRVFQVAIPGIVIFVWLLERSRLGRRLNIAALVVLALAGVAFVAQRQSTDKHYLDMPAGHAAFLFKPTYDRYRWIGENTRPGELFYEPHHPNFYFPFALRNPTPLYMARDSDYTPTGQVMAVVGSLEISRPRLILWPAAWSKSGTDRSPDDHLEPLWQFVQQNYQRIHVFTKPVDPMLTDYSDTEVWQLKQ